MTSTLAHTPMFDWHAGHGGRMVDFAGWSMPVQYASIVAEHTATRTAAGLFDISHMGRLRFDGAGAGEFLDSLLTRRVLGMSTGQIRYSLMCNAEGGILDDVLVYRIEEGAGVPYYWLVVNAGNRAKIVDWINGHLEGASDVEFSDLTETTAMIAVQGPAALDILRPLVKHDAAEMKYYTACETEFASHDALISRTGYTGEDGAELIVPKAAGQHVWRAILEQGRAAGAVAAGLGCRDTLRLEAAMPLYGHELSEQINPFQAGLGFAVNLRDRSFVGSDALARLKEDSTQPRRVR
ncbi:MAG: glycine cleavage system aminomethyltransferase GcvT, partial [Planctomycetes bacterium]|nr:glycine cleavage system aminomethyltransferase GcvT [Planctomycetota bacterium]